MSKSNPSPSTQAAQDNRANQLNTNNPAYWSARGQTPPPPPPAQPAPPNRGGKR